MASTFSFRDYYVSHLQMGYNAGDGIHYYNHPQSFTTDLVNVFSTSNVDIPGVWIFRLDSEDTAIVQCSTQSFGNEYCQWNNYMQCLYTCMYNIIIVI